MPAWLRLPGDRAEVKASPRRAILLSLGVALLLSALPVPARFEPYVPLWVLLVFCYWSMAAPDRVGPLSALCLGLLLDVQQGTVLGENALALVVVSGLISYTYLSLRMFPMIRQSMAILFLLMLYLLVRLVVRVLIGAPPTSWLYFASLPLSLLLWPWVFLLLRDIRRRFAPA